MTSRNLNPKRVLAIDPTSRGFGYVVFESATTLVDWGGRVIERQDETKTLQRISELIAHYQAQTIVIEEPRGSRRCPRVQKLLHRIAQLAMKEGIKSQYISVAQVKKAFRAFRAKTKHQIAHAVAQQLPDLAPHVPRYRKAWMSEASQMAIFDAAALALTYFYAQGSRRRVLPTAISKDPGAANNKDSV